MSLGDKLMIALVVTYIVIASVFAWEHTWAKMWYWIGASIITTSVLAMK